MTGSAARIVWIVIIVALAITWLPYFDILNDPVFIGPLPLPLAVTLACNVVLTLCVFGLYRVSFRPFIDRLRRHEQDTK